jgi:tetratricopeptide (TPR) repeat protein
MKAKLYTLLVMLLLALPNASVLAQDEEPEELPYGLDPMSVYSIFQESFKTKDYDLALMYGIPLQRIYPKKIEGLPAYKGDDVLDKIIDIFAAMSVKQKDPTKRTALLDSSLKYFNLAFTSYGPTEMDMFNWTLKRGRFYQEHGDFINGGGAKAYDDYIHLIDTDTQKMAEIGNGYYIQATLQYLVTQGERDKALEIINKTLPFADESTKAFIDKIQNQLFSNPVERITFLEGKLADAPKDISILKELYDLYQKVNDLERARETAKVMYEVNPNFDNSLTMAIILKKNSDNKGSVKILNDAISKANTSSEKATIYYELADSYLLLEDLQKARDNAKKAISENNKWGQPYIKLAAIYAQAVSSCAASNMEREDKVVYWLVLDLLDKAKQVDSEVTSIVNNLYKSYLPVTPTAEEKFFKGWKKGEPIKVDKSLRSCYDWINESTTIR